MALGTAPGALVCSAILLFFTSCHCAAPPFNLPPWPATYDMRASTLTMACNYTGTLNVTHYARFGIVDVDWSNHKEGSPSSWANQHPMNADVSLERQAAALKSAACPRKCPLPRGCASRSDCPSVRVFVYRNLVKVRGRNNEYDVALRCAHVTMNKMRVDAVYKCNKRLLFYTNVGPPLVWNSARETRRPSIPQLLRAIRWPSRRQRQRTLGPRSCV